MLNGWRAATPAVVTYKCDAMGRNNAKIGTVIRRSFKCVLEKVLMMEMDPSQTERAQHGTNCTVSVIISLA